MDLLIISCAVLVCSAFATIAYMIGNLAGQLKSNNLLSAQLKQKDLVIDSQTKDILSLSDNFTTLEKAFEKTFIENDRLKVERAKLLIPNPLSTREFSHEKR